MEREAINNSARIAGGVRRYHTWPIHNEQTVAEHSWQLYRIYCQIWGPPKPAVGMYIIFHDIGEMRTGDAPFPVKLKNPDLKAELDRIEKLAVIEILGWPIHEGLTDYDYMLVKICDLIDMYEYGAEEWLKGNQFAKPIIVDTKKAALDYIRNLIPDDQVRAFTYLDKMEKFFCLPF